MKTDCHCDHCQGIEWPAPKPLESWMSKNRARKFRRMERAFIRGAGRRASHTIDAIIMQVLKP